MIPLKYLEKNEVIVYNARIAHIKNIICSHKNNQSINKPCGRQLHDHFLFCHKQYLADTIILKYNQGRFTIFFFCNGSNIIQNLKNRIKST